MALRHKHNYNRSRVYRSRWWRKAYLQTKQGAFFRGEYNEFVLLGVLVAIILAVVIVLAAIIF